MTARLLIAAVAVAFLASPAAARDGWWYVGVEGGPMWLTEMEFDYEDGNGAAEDALPIDHELGFDLGLVGGYDFGGVRAEAEIAYKRASVDEMGLVDPDTGEGFEADGRASALSAMVNLLADFGADDRFSGYVGGGVGLTQVRYRAGDEGFATGFDDEDGTWALQLIAGLRTAISPNVDVGLKYRYFHTGRLKFDGVSEFSGAGPFTLKNSWRSHSLLASIVLNFAPPRHPPN